jgi:phosphoesterase RecJ-like protein
MSIRERILVASAELELLASARDPVIVTHPSPDVDGVASAMALALGLRALGSAATAVVEDPIPPRLQPMCGVGPLVVVGRDEGAEERVRSADLVVVVDTSHLPKSSPVGGLVDAHRGPVLVIDHHVPRKRPRGIVIPESASTGEIVYHLLGVLGAPVTEDIAHLVYLSIAYDTHSFRFLRDAAATFAVAAHLVELGADAMRAQRELFQQASVDSLTFLSRALAASELACDGRIAWVLLDDAVHAGLTVEPEDYRDVIQRLISTAGVRVAMTMTPRPSEGRIRISLRAKGEVDVEPLARRFGGGGHPQACGASVRAKRPDKLIKRLLQDLAPLVA